MMGGLAAVGAVILLAHGALLAQGDDAMNASEKSRIARILTPVAETEAKKQRAVEGLIRKYVADLKSAEIEVARSGDLEAVRAVRAEREAWEKGESAPGFDAAGKRVLAKVATLRKKLDAEIQALEKETQRLLEQEKAKAIRALDAMKVELTRATRIDAALELDKQIGELKSGSLDVARAAADQAGESGAGTLLSGDTTSKPSEATKGRPFVNSLGMRFVHLPRTKVLLCIWETRVRDFQAFVRESGYSWGEKPSFEQTPDDPVVMVSGDDAKAFCLWLSKKEGREYRLPTAEEWHAAAGEGPYPWGGEWPPPEGTENIAGEESKIGAARDPRALLAGYKDNHARTAPVGSYRANKGGFYDMGGNVCEWVNDWLAEADFRKRHDGGRELKVGELAEIQKGNGIRVAWGQGWHSSIRARSDHCSMMGGSANYRSDYCGFRCALAVSSR